jgi:hypothetical protein
MLLGGSIKEGTQWRDTLLCAPRAQPQRVAPIYLAHGAFASVRVLGAHTFLLLSQESQHNPGTVALVHARSPVPPPPRASPFDALAAWLERQCSAVCVLAWSCLPPPAITRSQILRRVDVECVYHNARSAHFAGRDYTQRVVGGVHLARVLRARQQFRGCRGTGRHTSACVDPTLLGYAPCCAEGCAISIPRVSSLIRVVRDGFNARPHESESKDRVQTPDAPDTTHTGLASTTPCRALPLQLMHAAVAGQHSKLIHTQLSRPPSVTAAPRQTLVQGTLPRLAPQLCGP